MNWLEVNGLKASGINWFNNVVSSQNWMNLLFFVGLTGIDIENDWLSYNFHSIDSIIILWIIWCNCTVYKYQWNFIVEKCIFTYLKRFNSWKGISVDYIQFWAFQMFGHFENDWFSIQRIENVFMDCLNCYLCILHMCTVYSVHMNVFKA